MKVFWMNLDVQLEEPLQVVETSDEDDLATRITGQLVHGALIEVGVTAETSEQAEAQLLALVEADPDLQDLSFELVLEGGELDEDELREDVLGDPELAPHLAFDPRQPGIWYRSGKIWYQND